MTYDEIVKKYKNLVWHEAHRHHKRFPSSTTIVDDLAQEGFLILFQKMSNYDPDKNAFTTWAVTVLRNHFRQITGKSYLDNRLGFSTSKYYRDIWFKVNKEPELIDHVTKKTADIIRHHQETGRVALNTLETVPEPETGPLQPCMADLNILARNVLTDTQDRTIFFSYLNCFSAAKVAKELGLDRKMVYSRIKTIQRQLKEVVNNEVQGTSKKGKT